MPVGELLTRMSSWELAYWLERGKTEYLGEERADFRNGQQLSQHINMQLPEGAMRAKASDYMHWLEPPLTEEEIAQNEADRIYIFHEAQRGLAMAAAAQQEAKAQGQKNEVADLAAGI